LQTSSGTFSQPGDFVITTGSYAIAGGTTVPVYRDFYGNFRNGGMDIGAFKQDSDPTELSSSTCLSISQYGITWTFDHAYACGQFVNGDYWVVGPVTVSSVSPGWDGTKNGSMLDPVPDSDTQGYDSRLSSYHYPYNAGDRVVFPTTISSTKSLVSTKGLATYDTGVSKSSIDSAAVLTIVDSPVATNTFRPAYVSGSKTFFNTSQVNYGLLPSLPAPGNVIDLTNVMKMPWLQHGSKVFGEEVISRSQILVMHIR
jgi:hypothetical protein